MSRIFLLIGPSGAGKSSLGNALRAALPELGTCVGCTTRPPRPGELDGVDYRFVTVPQFEALREEGGFAEWAVVHGNMYGTPRSEVEGALNQGRDLLFEIDRHGARQLRALYPDQVRAIMIAPPSLEEAERRLRARGADSEETVNRRVQRMAEELQPEPGLFHAWLVNEDWEATFAVLKGMIEDPR